jgi:dipeptidyl aminopeptidase/acylaminoacyl peptidase
MITDPEGRRVPLPSFREFVPVRRFLDVIAVSPDGSTLAYVSNDGGQYNLWLRSLGGDGEPRQVTSFADRSVRSVAWSPDGAGLAFSADRDGDEQFQVFVVDRDGAAPRRLTHSDGSQFQLSSGAFTPDGRCLAYAGNDRDRSVQDVIVHDVVTGEVVRVEPRPGFLAFAVATSPDGRWLLGMEARSNTDMDVFVADLRDPALPKRVITPHDGEEVNMPVGWLADSSGILLITNAGREFRALACVGLDGTVVTIEEPGWDVEDAALSRDGSTLVWVVNESGTSKLWARRDAASGLDGDATLVGVPTGVLRNIALSPDGSALVGLFGTGARPHELVHIDLGRAVSGRVQATSTAVDSVTVMTDSRPPAQAQVSAVDPVHVSFPTHDGRTVPAWLYRANGDGRRPVVLSIHGGPEAQEKAEYMYSGLYQYLLSRGIGILAPNVRGSTGYGVSYQKLIHRDWGGAELGDFEHAVAYVRSLDWVDPARIGVFGGSFGGFAALSCVARLPELFAAGVSIVGPSNLVTLVRSVPPTWRPIMSTWVGDPDADFDFLMSRSPITYADQIVSPLMVVQGANDPRVAKAESDQIVEALEARGIPVRYDVYTDEGHGFTKRENEIKALGDVGEFLVTHLVD